jgi:uracil-DNA glycosylase
VTTAALIRALASTAVSERACNQYADDIVRRRNLKRYLEELGAIGPRVLLIGEAPSHRGARLTGIPFVSESIMLSGIPIASPPHHIFGEQFGYRKATPGPTRSTEASATMVWETIRGIDPLPLLWNAFPFHPHDAGNPLTNRFPTAAEVLIGQRFIAMLLQLFPIERIIAVGNAAAASLTRMDLAHEKIRHPSQGGKRAFVAGLRLTSS